MESPSSHARPPRFDGVQALRCLAVLLVVWTHAKHVGGLDHVFWMNNYVGSVGVDIFFVISGFVISLSAQSLNYDAPRFLFNRITRVVPLYWLTALPLIAMGWRKGTLDWNGVLTTFTFLPLLDFDTFHAPTNAFGWTLSFEFWFYVCFAAGLALFRSRGAWVLCSVLFAGALLVAGFYKGSYFLPKFLFCPLIFEFFAGVAIHRFMHLLHRRSVVPCTVAAVALFAYLCTTGHPGDYVQDAGDSAHRALLWGGVGFFAVAAAVAAEQSGFTRWPAWMVKGGEYSFSMYLIQPYSLWLAKNLGNVLGLGAWSMAALFVAASVVGGALMSIYIEMPLMRLARGLRKRPAVAPVGKPTAA